MATVKVERAPSALNRLSLAMPARAYVDPFLTFPFVIKCGELGVRVS